MSTGAVLCPIALFSMLSSSALAFAPAGDPDDQRAIDLAPQRIFVTHPEEQGRWLASPAWRAFTAAEGAGWSARFDESTATVRYLWGPGIAMPADPDGIAAALTALVGRHQTLFGAAPETLRLRSAHHVAQHDTWYVELDALREGLPTWAGGISARIKHGNLVHLTVGTAPRAAVVGGYSLGAAAAIDEAIAQGPAPRAIHTEPSAEPILLERRGDDGFVLQKTWLVRTDTASPPGRWVSFVDGETGALLSVHNEVRYIDGTVTAEHHERSPDGSPLVTSGVPYVTVSNGSTAVTDVDGNYTITGGGPYGTDLDGSYVEVLNAAGGEGYLSSNDVDMTWDDREATQAEIDSYIFLNQVKVWGETYAPEVGWVAGPIRSYVNINDNCNAYFDGNVNFFTSGGGCNNTGESADVNYHEWGHGFHYYSLQAGFFDGSLSEGAGDTVSFLMTQDRYIGPYFFTNGSAIRDVGPNQVYPQDFINNGYYVHYNGLIFGGAFWDLLGLISDREGEAAGVASTSHIFAGTLKGGPDIPGSFYEAVVADDDDGDLGNGTPHICDIYDAFGQHGLGTQLGVEAVLASHAPIEDAEPRTPAPIEAELLSVAQGCTAVEADQATVYWRVDGGDWEQANLSTPGQRVEGEIPGQRPHSFVEYYIDGSTAQGEEFAIPASGRTNPFTYYVGGNLIVHCDDFEDDDGGYRHELVAGEEGEGADDWQWGTPMGQSGDPAARTRAPRCGATISGSRASTAPTSRTRSTASSRPGSTPSTTPTSSSSTGAGCGSRTATTTRPPSSRTARRSGATSRAPTATTTTTSTAAG